jgi:hypothetical protein
MTYTSDKRLHVNSDRTKIVPEDHPDVGYLLVGEGGELSDEEAAKYGLGKTKSDAKAEHAPPENKAEPAPTTKGTGSGLTINKAR